MRQNKKGFTSDNLCALNSKKGHKVVYVYTDNKVTVDPQTSDDIKGNSIRFTINLPWDQIKGNFENSSGNQYISDTVFFIKKSLQVGKHRPFKMGDKIKYRNDIYTYQGLRWKIFINSMEKKIFKIKIFVI